MKRVVGQDEPEELPSPDRAGALVEALGVVRGAPFARLGTERGPVAAVELALVAGSGRRRRGRPKSLCWRNLWTLCSTVWSYGPPPGSGDRAELDRAWRDADATLGRKSARSPSALPAASAAETRTDPRTTGRVALDPT